MEWWGQIGGSVSSSGGSIGRGIGGAVAAAIAGSAGSILDKPKQCPPKPGNQDPCKGLREQLAAHEAKLAQYLNDPISMDNKGFLNGAIGKGNMDLFWKIRANRIKELEWQIENFRKQLEQCEARYG